MFIGLLGALEVVDDDGHDIVIGGAKLRAFVALLALDVGRVVPTEQLIDSLWGEDPPAAVRNSLQGLASKLRRLVGSAGAVAMRGDGYVLDLPADAVDVHRYEALVAAGRAAAAAGDIREARAKLEEAEGLWRGEPLADFVYDEFAVGAIARLTELRLAVTEERLDLALTIGGHANAVVELESLVARHPLREQLRSLLMLALYRTGRQADALRTYQEGRRILGEELGLEPGPALRTLESAILAHDPALDAPGGSGLAEPARRVAPAAGTTLPAPLGPLIGRAAACDEVRRLVDEHRLVTLVGPGGVGKTRLALEVARAVTRSTETEADAHLVELAPVGDPAGARAAVASALELPDPAELGEMIGDRELLLVLDNCEHVIGAAAQIADDLLRRCPGLRILATSREALRIGGEIVWSVPPLGTDAAVELFRTRAEAAGAHLDGTDELSESIADICDRLDGLPLAIELAAARARAFPIRQIAGRLDDRFRLLTGGSRVALPRQQTLRAIVDWSYGLLFEDEQRVFERLSVFPGGCDLTSAEAVCADGSLAAFELADIIQALVDKSLVVAVPNGDSARFTQLQTLAQYAGEKLAERGDAEAMRTSMATHFAALCAESPSAYVGHGQRAWLATMHREQDNLRAALEWAAANDDAETALTIAGGASWPHWLSGTLIEGRRWLDVAFACGGQVSEAVTALALTGRALLEFLTGEQARADADLESAIATFTAAGDQAALTLALSFHTEIAAVNEDVATARRRRLAVLDFYADQPDTPFVVAARAYSRGKLAVLDGNLEAAEDHYRTAASGFGRIDTPVMYSMSLGMVADFDERAGDHAAAIAALESAISTNDDLGLRGFTGSLVVRLGWQLLHAGELDRAEETFERALDEAMRLRNGSSSTPWRPITSLVALGGMAVVHCLRGRHDAARAPALEALDMHVAGGARRFRNRIDPRQDLLAAAAASCAVLAADAAAGDDGERTAHLLGHAERLRAMANTSMPPLVCAEIERARERGIELLGPDRFLALVETARHEKDDQVLARSAAEPLPRR